MNADGRAREPALEPVADRLSDRRATRLVQLASLTLAAPALAFRYLPMTDLPQYAAAAAILGHLSDAQFGFGAYYEPAWDRTLAWLPYALMRLLTLALPLETALRLLVFASLCLQPLGLLALLDALGKPRLYALVAFPIVYSSQFYWGLLPSNLSIGMALFACARVTRPGAGWRGELGLALLGVAVALTHVFGLCALLAFAWLWTRRGRSAERRLPRALWPAAALCLPWLWFAESAEPTGQGLHPMLSQRIFLVADNLLGGFRGPYEGLLLLAWAGGVWLWLHRSFPRSAEDWAELAPEQRVVFGLAGASVILYFVLPMNTPASNLIFPRVGALALLFSPLLLPPATCGVPPRFAWSFPLIIALASIVHATARCAAFDAEARDFDAISSAATARARAVALIFDDHGEISAAHPYLQFGGYLQARKGGYLGSDFFRAAWTVPVRQKPDAPVPPAVRGLPWNPAAFYSSPALKAYDEVLVRGPEPRELTGVVGFDYQLVTRRGAWSLYRNAHPASAGMQRMP